MNFDKGSGILRPCVAVMTLTAAVTVGSTGVAGTTNLFEQPLESGIASNLFVAHVTKAGMPKGTFDMVVLQPNPLTSNGYLVPTSWNAGSKTGFAPTSPSTAQLGFLNKAGTSTAQTGRRHGRSVYQLQGLADNTDQSIDDDFASIYIPVGSGAGAVRELHLVVEW